MNLSDFQKKLIWSVGVISILSLWIAFPMIFKALIESYKLPKDFNEFGPFGDIYGSLNTLFTSLTVVLLIYSALQQRKANRDAREAMTTQLNQAKNTSKNQLNFSRLAHNAQMKEIRKSNFDNKFYSLLNYKMELFNNIKASNPEDGDISGAQVFDRITTFFTKELLSRPDEDPINLTTLKSAYFSFISKLNNRSPLTSIYSYFLIYESLFLLLDTSDLEEKEKNLYLHLIRNSCLASEQLTIFFISPLYVEFMDIFKDKEIFHSFDSLGYLKYAKAYFDESYFFNNVDKKRFK
ncbi:hypothetical protein [Acinetobacter baumannii]|uniref:hypothetical protein n=1 Tax=Acinetobacter baumannii TaxID=470 RepID=UPI0005F98D9F|nr:hypothetical protein [Acinetobacter baumannii]KJX73443.1 hypothetical protein WH42_04785 [Acinetobacter baumannii]MCO9032210.1 hypothetical protein [Acinetobacter baumannii]MCO9037063.1 hypothetical protein [Acinetobacter baumannii]MCO9041372.1 hypothetical protein [Acinetobacter baumannii]USZ92130.1 hypothetical protein KQ251_14675 [Acinetobacter baumannii]